MSTITQRLREIAVRIGMHDMSAYVQLRTIAAELEAPAADSDQNMPRLKNHQIDAIADLVMEPCDSGDAVTDDLDRVVLRRFARAIIRESWRCRK